MQVQNNSLFSISPKEAWKIQERIDQELDAIFCSKSMEKAYPEACNRGGGVCQVYGESRKPYLEMLGGCATLLSSGMSLTEEIKTYFYEEGFSQLKKDLEKNEGEIEDYLEYRCITNFYDALVKYSEEQDEKEIAAKEKIQFLQPFLPKIEKSYLSFHIENLKKQESYFSEYEKNIVELAHQVVASLDKELAQQQELINQKKDLAKRCDKLATNMLLYGQWESHEPLLEAANKVLANPNQYNYYHKAVAAKNLKALENSDQKKPKSDSAIGFFLVNIGNLLNRSKKEENPDPT